MAEKAKKIVAADAAVINRLYAQEVSKIAADQKVKIATPEDPQAFRDHQEYTSLLENVMREDKGQSWDPNDPLKD